MYLVTVKQRGVQASTSKSMFQTPTLNYRLCSAAIKAEVGLYAWCWRAGVLSPGFTKKTVSCVALLRYFCASEFWCTLRFYFRWAIYSCHMENIMQMEISNSLEVQKYLRAGSWFGPMYIKWRWTVGCSGGVPYLSLHSYRRLSETPNTLFRKKKSAYRIFIVSVAVALQLGFSLFLF